LEPVFGYFGSSEVKLARLMPRASLSGMMLKIALPDRMAEDEVEDAKDFYSSFFISFLRPH
jgi:hypothetical protein